MTVVTKEAFETALKSSFRNKILLKGVTAVVNHKGKTHFLTANDETYNRLKEKEKDLEDVFREKIYVEIYRLEFTSELEKEFKEVFGKESFAIINGG